MSRYNREQSFEAIVRTAIDAIIVIDENNVIRSWNPGAERLLGWTAAEIVGKDMGYIVPEALREGHRRGMQRYLDTRVPNVLGKSFVELPSLHKNGYEIPTTISIATWEEEGQVFFTGIIRDITQRVKERERTNLLIKELNHRVKNSLTIIISIVAQTARFSKDVDEMQQTLQERLYSMAKVHDLLVQSDWSHATLADIINMSLEPYGRKYIYEGPNMKLRPGVAVMTGMAVHELATNCVKYGAWSVPDGYVTISGDVIDNMLHMTWKERGGPLVTEPENEGFGMIMLKRLFAGSLRGKTEVEFEPDGLRYTVIAPPQVKE